MSRLALSLAALALVICATPSSRADDMARIKHLRVGGHAKYDRLVLELDAPVRVVWGTGDDPFAPVFEIAARPLHPQVLDTALKRIGTIRIESIPAGARIRLDSKRRRIRVFELQRPPRLVVDFADPGNAPFEAPRGTRAIDAQLNPALASAPKTAAAPQPKRAPAPKPTRVAKPAPTRSPAPQTQPAQTQPAKAQAPEARSAEARPAADAATRRSPFDPPTRELIGRSFDAEPLAPTPEPEPEIETEPAAQLRDSEAPEPTRAEPKPGAWPAATRSGQSQQPGSPQRDAASEDRLGLWIGLGALGLVVLFVLIGLGVRGMRGSSAGSVDEDLRDSSAGYAPETITPEELYGDGTRLEFLDKRLDGEVRARMQLEERVLHANEELKVMRDRLGRLERKRGA